ncbi:STP1 protein [Plasmodium ovale wallikeri]|uniref:STP1 protein n=1 Tax=Plasmodium ovale wallikeri TaxID=864142 RepID=A0A1A9A4D0_PLAOA|nr:STP1 protein [Plasmodium ovale wallikeri]
MKSFTHTCNRIKAASQRDTNNIFLPYRTPILQGAISIITEFEKNKDDGVDFVNLCDELNKYVNKQKECIDPNLKKKNMNLFNTEWRNTIKGIQTTFTKKRINRLCYWEGDKKKSVKEHVLGIYDQFRNFCIEKKQRETRDILNFQECMDYLQWIDSKKKLFLALDPKYSNIKEYKDYFNIRDKCNYPWLVSNIPDVTCTQSTTTKPKEKDSEKKSSADTGKPPPDVIPVSTVGENKNAAPPAQPSSKGDGATTSVNSPNSSPEKAPAQSTPSGDDNVNHVHQFNDLYLQGTPVDDPNPFPKSPPKYSDPEVQEFIEKHIQNSFHGHIITHDTRHAINRMPHTIYKYNTNNVHSEAITPPITKPNISTPLEVLYSQRFIQLLHSERFRELLRLKSFRQLLHSKRFLSNIFSKERYIPPIIHSQKVTPAIPPKELYFPKTKPTKTQVAFIPAEAIFYPKITTDPAIPGPSHFRYPFMIYTLVFLTISTAITIFYLLSKYTPLGLLFSKKKKKKRLKRQLEIKKIPEESPSFDKITNYSVNDMPYENKTHDDNNIYSKIKIHKVVINKNISLPKKKKNKRKAIIDIHMELLNEYKNDEWELNKNDFLQICLEEFVREQNKIYSNSENTNLVMKNISIQNTKDKMVLLDKWTERCRPIWEKFKSENAFKVLQNEWKKEEMEYLENIEQFENIILNENTKISYKEIKKEIWRKWITKQAKFIEQFTQETWFKSLVKQIEDVSDEYKMGEIKDDIFVLNTEKLDNVNNNEELYKHDNNSFLIKVLTQIFMMVIEESIKEESPEKTELVLDNIIGKINKEKLQNIKSHHVENTYEKSKDHLEYNEMLEKDTHKYKDSFKELMEGWMNKPNIDINSADDKNKSDKWVEMTDKNFLNPNDGTSENPNNYIRKE